MPRRHTPTARLAALGAVLVVVFGLALLALRERIGPASAAPGPEAAAAVPAGTPGARRNAIPAIGEALARASGTSSVMALSQSAREQLRAAYVRAGGGPRWLDEALRPGADAGEALQLLAGARREGLDPEDYQAGRLSERAVALASAPAPPAPEAAAFDVDLSASMVRYLRDLHLGRVDPRTIGFRMQVGGDEHDFPSLLFLAIAAHRVSEAAAELEPQSVFYRGLRAALLHYRSMPPEVAVALPPADGVPVKPGGPYAGLAALRNRLVVLGDWPHDTEAPAALATALTYDGPWVEAVARFQARHGLEPDGVLGASTVAALRVPIATRIRQIEMGLERLRWLPHVPTGPLVTVNIPMFRLWAWDAIGSGGMPSFESKVIVGRGLDNQTPVFEEQMRHVIFRPYWNVPMSIVRDEILPALAKNPAYLQTHQMEIVDGPGDGARPVTVTPAALEQLRAGGLRLRQRPGPANALGLVKFVFPNDEHVYLHGTPSPALFDRSRRDLSHGCVRVEEPVALAEWVLGREGQWNRGRIISAMQGPAPSRVDLSAPIPVVLFYSTALVWPDGGLVHFAPDIYRHDETLDRALGRRAAAR